MQENAYGFHTKFTYGQKNGVLSLTSTEIVVRFNVSASSITIPWKDVIGTRLVVQNPAETTSIDSNASETKETSSNSHQASQPEVFKSRTFHLHPFHVTSTPVVHQTSHGHGDGASPSMARHETSSKLNNLDVYYACRKVCSEWVVSRLSLCHASVDVLTQMGEVIDGKIAEITSRPKTVLVFINPYGGRRLAAQIYDKNVAPVFEVAGVKADVVVTTRKNHAFDHLEANDVSQFDAVVGVGGDGLISEIINGMWARLCQKPNPETSPEASSNQEEERSEQEQPVFPTALGVIPGGSTNTLDYSLNGKSSPMNAAVNIALGRRLKMDVMGVYQNDALVKLCFNGIFYGFLGDMMWRSEKLRFLGPPRYNVSGVQTFLGDSSKRLECEYLGVEDSSGKTSPKCRRECSTCSLSSGEGEVAFSEAWKSISGKFTQVGGMVHSLLSSYSPQGLSPGAHLGDGYLDVICVKNTNKFDLLRFLMMTRFNAEKKFDLPFVTFLRVKELRIKPESDAGGFFNCDGELLPAGPIHCRMFRQLLEVFSYGNDVNITPPLTNPEAPEVLETTTCSTRSGLNFFSRFTQQMRLKKKKANIRNPSTSSSSVPGIDLIFSWKRNQNERSGEETP